MRRWIGVTTSAAAAGLAGLVLVACASQVTPFTPEPEPAVAADEAREAADVADAFFALMADPEVPYRVESEVKRGSDGRGGPAITLRGRYDVAADDYAGQASGTAVKLENATADLYVVTLEDETRASDFTPDTLTSVDSAVIEHRPNALADLKADDLVFMGRTTDGLFEFDVRRWLFGDPISSWSALRGFGDAEVPPTSAQSHRGQRAGPTFAPGWPTDQLCRTADSNLARSWAGRSPANLSGTPPHADAYDAWVAGQDGQLALMTVTDTGPFLEVIRTSGGTVEVVRQQLRPDVPGEVVATTCTRLVPPSQWDGMETGPDDDARLVFVIDPESCS